MVNNHYVLGAYLSIFVFFCGCSSIRSVDFHPPNAAERRVDVIGSIEIVDAVRMELSVRGNYLRLVASSEVVEAYMDGDADIDKLLRRSDVYFSGENPYILNDTVFRDCHIGLDQVRDGIALSETVHVNPYVTNCFVIVVMDYRTYIETQHATDSYVFPRVTDWMFVKVAYGAKCDQTVD